MRTSPAFIFFLISCAALVLWPSAKLETAATHPSAFNLTGDGRVMLIDVQTGERLSIVYRGADGAYNESALDAVDRVLRCHGDQEMFPISLKLVELIDHLEDHFGSSEILIVSGYRSPEYNAALRRKLKRVAHASLHMKGMAMDIRLPAIDKRALGNYARALATGGVGVYRGSNFVHVDVGDVRSW